MSSSASKPRLAIVGGGVAGLAAAEAALRAGYSVELYEARARLGGRAGSFYDPRAEQWIDHGQHLALGCCTELFDFLGRLGLADVFERHDTFHFLAPDGRQYDFTEVRWLPPPLHLVPGLLRLGYLTWRERCGVLAGLARLASDRHVRENETIGQWLVRHRQTPAAIERFWKPILTSALGELPDRLAVAAAQQVFADGFLSRQRRAYQMFLPQTTLADLFDRQAAEALQTRGAALCRSTPVRTIEGDARRVQGLTLADGRTVAADVVILAVGWRQASRLLAPELLAALPAFNAVAEIPCAAIAAVHLWFDRPLTALRHAALVEGVGQWLFTDPQPSPIGHHVQVVISAADQYADGDSYTLVSQVLQELQERLPGADAARLIHQRVIHTPAAVFALQPGVDARRPPQRTPIAGLALAGDWTRTGWPATMEGAVRSGRMAVAELAREAALSRPASGG